MFEILITRYMWQVDVQDTEITNLESQLGLTKADCRDLQNQMSLINGLFTQMLLGASSADMDLDRLTQLLQVLLCNIYHLHFSSFITQDKIDILIHFY